MASVPAEPAAPTNAGRGAPAEPVSFATRLRGGVAALLARGQREDAEHLPVSPSAMNEELAVALLYGKRSGSVTASPARPPH